MSESSSPYALVRAPIDLTTCDLEPVHLIGTVQNHGGLLVFDQAGALLEASENWPTMLGHDRQPLTLQNAFPQAIGQALEKIKSSDSAFVLPQQLENRVEVSALRADDGRLVVELEALEGAKPFDPIGSLNGVLRSLSQAQTASDYLHRLAQELRAALGIDHIMIYRFLPDWAGEVVAESTDGPKYLGLRFPATDIPEPARRVFHQVWVRHIAEVSAPPVPVRGASNQLTSMNMTQVGIRAASPIHLEYLANMGVGASLTISLRIGDRLWGLVACHHRSPYRIPPSARASLEILGQMASFQLSTLLQNETRDERVATEARLSELDRALESNDDPSLSHHLDAVQQLLPSDMAAVFEDQRWSRKAGLSLEALEKFSAWLNQEAPDTTLYQRNDLPPGLIPGYAGALAVREHGRLVCWFRREQTHSVRWAGNPDKTAQVAPTGRLNPRASFAEYVENTQGKSLPWSELDLWKADRFLDVMRSLTARIHRRLEIRNEALSRSNRELDSFAYMASHDLKEPLRGIHNYATFLKEDYGDRLDGDGLVFLDGLTHLSKRMTVLLDSLLAYSRLNSQTLEIKDCDLNVLVRDSFDLLQVTRRAVMEVKGPLPVVQAYPPFLSEILMNLLTNAVKYSDESDRKIEVGGCASVDSGFDTFYVRDNGIGIDPVFHEEVFQLFRRLHGEGQRGDGSGVGLTIVQKMVERHGGKVWVESQPEQGSTFYVALPQLKERSASDQAGQNGA